MSNLEQALESIDSQIKKMEENKKHLQKEIGNIEVKTQRLLNVRGAIAALQADEPLQKIRKNPPANHSSQSIMGMTDKILNILDKQGPCTALQVSEHLKKDTKITVPFKLLRNRVRSALSTMTRKGYCKQRKYKKKGRQAEYYVK